MSGTVLLTSWEEKEETSEDGVVWRKLDRGDPHVRAIYGAVVDRFLSTPRSVIEDEIAKFVDEKVTLVTYGENMIGGGLITAKEGKIVAVAGGYGILPKGARTKGFRVNPDKVLYVLPGYSTDKAAQLVENERLKFPVVKALTQERLNELPTNSETLSLCVFGEHRLPDSTQHDALYLVSEYWPSEDIIEGVLLCRASHGTSESGSIYGRQLLATMGEVVGFDPISFAEGLHLCNVDFDDAFYQVTCWQTDAAR